MTEEFQSERKSKFNYALAKLERMNEIRKGAINARIHKNYRKWFDCLMSLRSEMNERMDLKDRGIADTFEHLISAVMNPIRAQINLYMGDFKEYINWNIASYLLNQYELFLGTLEDKFGVSLPDTEDARFALGY